MKNNKNKANSQNESPTPDINIQNPNNNLNISNLNYQNNQTSIEVPLSAFQTTQFPQQSSNTVFPPATTRPQSTIQSTINTGASVFLNQGQPVNYHSPEEIPNTEPIITDGDENPYQMPFTLDNDLSIEKARKYIWWEYLNQIKHDPARLKEVKNNQMTLGEVTMKYRLHIIGPLPSTGYPLFIALHGGGGSDTPDINDSQWEHMNVYYIDSVSSGIYLCPRGVRDTWDTHFNAESYALYDRLIMNMVVFHKVDPNRVYLTGYSAGGDGVYAIVARMSDRFAAANMSAGHPNGCPLWNVYNMPFALQVGELDFDYERNVTTARYDRLLHEYNEKLNGGYKHKAFIHAGKGHGIRDNTQDDQKVIEENDAWMNGQQCSTVKVDTNAIRFMQKYVRNPIPTRVVWDLSQRAAMRDVESFYWIRAEKKLNEGKIVASFDRQANEIHVEECSVKGEIVFLISSEMLDMFVPITVVVPGGGRCAVDVKPEFEMLFETTIERGDYNFQFAGKIRMTF